MYINPVFLPQFSNREDLLLTVSLFDDDTGQPIKVDGCTTASTQPFTGNAWTVTDGTIVTTSTTPMTIPVFPLFGNAQLNLNLKVGVGLAINPGDPIVITDTSTIGQVGGGGPQVPASGNIGPNTMMGYVLSYVISTGLLICQIGCSFTFEIRRIGISNDWSGYFPWLDVGTANESPIIAASLGKGVSIVDIGIIQLLIPASRLEQLYGGTYSVGLVVSDGSSTRQMFVGKLPVIYGGVSRVPVFVDPGPVWN
jgi:hypothetical protein